MPGGDLITCADMNKNKAFNNNSHADGAGSGFLVLSAILPP